MDRHNHYEAAFEAYLRQQRLCYIAVDESRRALLDEGSLKSLDFIVYGPDGARLLVDVKGRRFPGGSEAKPRRVWECWATVDDLDGLDGWARRFGPGYRAVLVFAYQLAPSVELPADTPDVWEWHDQRYLLRGVPATDYRQHMKSRSPRWGTVGLPRAAFRDLVRPFTAFTHSESVAVG